MKTPDGKEITDALLCERFPHLFGDRNAPLTQSLMGFGFEIGPGWMGIIYEAASKLEPLIVKMIDKAIKEKDFETLEFIPRASQVKEKYGTLCFYLSSGTDEMYKIVETAEKKSEKTCEKCGKAGKLRGKGWVYTRCNAHWKELKEEKYGK
jgi:hypothetical protein